MSRQKILSKTKKSAPPQRSFPWLLASFGLFCAIVGVLIYDVTQADGIFAKSRTGKLLNDAGVLEHTESAWRAAAGASARSYLWLEGHAPEYARLAADFARPYLALAHDVYLVALKQTTAFCSNVREYAEAKAPALRATADQYAPGALDTLQGYAGAAWAATSQYALRCYDVSAHYLRTNVFIGEWAPEILTQKTWKAFNQTQEYATQYYSWFQERVHTYSKIK